jgi:protein-S-isoprenylcysteine O-methyltransferase Ste14
MVVNSHLEVTVRIQDDRGHCVIDSGPYAIVRHPMYAGIVLQSVATPLLLGSSWAAVPVGITILLFAIRTALEDRTLRKELPGYEEFTTRTRFRLIPGLW